jgi:hypothetical protein
MNYLILGKPFSEESQAYRGIHRISPEHTYDPVPLKYWEWFNDNYEESYIPESDKTKAFELIKAYKRIGIDYELIRIARDFEDNNKDEFLGIDIASDGGISILAWYFLKDGFTSTSSDPLSGIAELLFRYFKPRINQYVLLQNKSDANLFIKVVEEMQAVNPVYFEDFKFLSHYLYLVKE